MQYKSETYASGNTAPPRMATASFKMPVTNPVGSVFRRQNTASRLISQQQPQQVFNPVPGTRAPMMMPRCATASLYKSSTPSQPHADVRKTPQAAAQTRLIPTNNIRTVVLPTRTRGNSIFSNAGMSEKSPAAVPRQATGVGRGDFTPASYVTKVYPNFNPVDRSAAPSRVPTTPIMQQPRASTGAVPYQGQRGQQTQNGYGNHVAFKGRNKIKATSVQRQPSVFKEVVDTIKEHAAVLPKIEAKEAAQLVGGFVSGTLSVLAHIVGDIRSDIINGMFKPEDPSYDAAKAYYYAANNHPTIPTGMTQRIDYIEEIERCTRVRSNSRRGDRRQGNVQKPRPQAAYPAQQPYPNYEPRAPSYEPRSQQSAPLHKPNPTAFGQDPHMFSMMSERALEEFLLNDGYLNSAPPSMPR
ncbi:SNF2-related domain-containing protein, putative [Babesia caballi]|uniref:SNF2-related domain-containing protein, putative n=1 Tax=Babesia caballi TaxID=5871 RepID=A0AAV4LM27_BABCB|nr:SNF2-related domain-containing protein, putative [Babesia caballi]